MPQLVWLKSSFSGGGNGDCIELATDPSDPSGRTCLRESDRPDEIATASPEALRGLIRSIQANGGLIPGV
ncbi:DUF397 domain-containing protein [Streptomyces sp. NPDC059009]|uniref:DUF397 domain-containing protein n=1 Tax=Streptomyces sp. NPDC059009 TaxID=3346694 RepID=UPI0036784A21